MGVGTKNRAAKKTSLATEKTWRSASIEKRRRKRDKARHCGRQNWHPWPRSHYLAEVMRVVSCIRLRLCRLDNYKEQSRGLSSFGYFIFLCSSRTMRLRTPLFSLVTTMQFSFPWLKFEIENEAILRSLRSSITKFRRCPDPGTLFPICKFYHSHSSGMPRGCRVSSTKRAGERADSVYCFSSTPS